MEKILARGAEAVLIKKDRLIIKKRIEKSYRHPTLDEKIRKQRTRAEARLLEKASKVISVPKLINVDEEKKEITLEYLNGKVIAQTLEKIKDKKALAKKVGGAVRLMHESNIVHGDLTTSNMILKEKKVYLIDFGLGYYSTRVEDFAVDLHVLKEALEAKHPQHAQTFWKSLISEYLLGKKGQDVLKRLEKVEKRGRYKSQY